MLSNNLVSAFIDFLYPPKCLVCGLDTISANKSSFSTDLCINCSIQDHPPTLITKAINPCKCCGEEMGGDSNSELSLCLSCRLLKPPMEKLVSLYSYTPQTANLLKALKYKRQWTLAKFIANLMAQNIYLTPLKENANWDIIVNIPSSFKNITQRGFNHNALIAHSLGKQLGLPIKLRALYTNNQHLSQASLTPEKRVKNVKGVFHANKHLVKNKHILLIDDVVTSSASLTEATKTLLEAGATSVDAYTFARSLKFRFSRMALLRM